MNTTKQDIIEIIKNAESKSDACRKLGFCINGTGIRKLKKLSQELCIDLSHFNEKKWIESLRKYKVITKECPVCGKKFEAHLGAPREKQTCSYGCANTLFRSGENNGIYKNGFSIFHGEHRKVCWDYWDHICAIPGCGWTQIVEVHHIDYNHNNNDYKNLIPLCPNHHRLTEMNKYKDEINEVIRELIQKKFT